MQDFHTITRVNSPVKVLKWPPFNKKKLSETSAKAIISLPRNSLEIKDKFFGK